MMTAATFKIVTTDSGPRKCDGTHGWPRPATPCQHSLLMSSVSVVFGTIKTDVARLPLVVFTLAFCGLSTSVAIAGSWQQWQRTMDDGLATLAQDAPEQALILLQDALAMAEANDPTDPRLAETLDGLAEIGFLQNRDAEVEAYYSRALGIREAAFGPIDPAVGESLGRLADFLFLLDRYDDAEPMYLRALAISERAGEPDGLVADLESLARFYSFSNRESDALPYLERALALRTQRLGADHVDLAPTLDAMAEVQFYLDRLDAAETLYRRSLALREAALGEEHPAVSGSMRRLAAIIRMRGRESEADQLTERAFTLEQARDEP